MKKYNITESEIRNLVKQILSEEYIHDKLYDRDIIIAKLRTGPRELRPFIRELPMIACKDSQGNKRVCTRIPEVVHVYITGRY